MSLKPVLPLRLTRRAKQDLRSIWRYSYAYFGRQRATQYCNAILEVFYALQMGDGVATAHQAADQVFLKVKSGRHFISYQQHFNGIAVYRILHERMNFDHHL